jgi:hypothetical protein
LANAKLDGSIGQVQPEMPGDGLYRELPVDGVLAQV